MLTPGMTLTRIVCKNVLTNANKKFLQKADGNFDGSGTDIIISVYITVYGTSDYGEMNMNFLRNSIPCTKIFRHLQ